MHWYSRYNTVGVLLKVIIIEHEAEALALLFPYSHSLLQSGRKNSNPTAEHFESVLAGVQIFIGYKQTNEQF